MPAEAAAGHGEPRHGMLRVVEDLDEGVVLAGLAARPLEHLPQLHGSRVGGVVGPQVVVLGERNLLLLRLGSGEHQILLADQHGPLNLTRFVLQETVEAIPSIFLASLVAAA
eukprot:CAMPEP_0179204242 /NCGR_PEP_ID=MMETSP0796-20121207/101815_1 /TAXON_ID=73915 /ORGANISM="Pyrodinium bahamense, Strain pbaha01" /LENGTH=111 /DNA_ID=CAMNT_0020909119 /DNA_START=258 /DNA_END=589 /DNA_ORIENTATION=-